MPKSALPLPVLTDEQKSIIKEYWYEDLRKLTCRVFGDQTLTLRNIESKAVRQYLSIIGATKEKEQEDLDPARHDDEPLAPVIGDDLAGELEKAMKEERRAMAKAEKPKPKPRPPKPAPRFDIREPLSVSLSEEQQEYIANNYKDANGPMELARVVFKTEKLHPGSTEVRAVSAYIRKIDPHYRKEDEPAEDVDYKPPLSIYHLIKRLNKFDIGDRPDGKKLSDGGLTGQESKQLDAMLGFMKRPVFKVEADKFTKKIDRDVFESVFLSTCWDKPDLSPEHVIQYIQLASISAQRNQADRLVRKLDERFTLSLDDPDKKLSKPEVDALNATRDKATEHLKQINQLIKTLTGDRAKIVSERVAGAASMHPLVQAWKQEESRKKILALVQKKQQSALKKEVERMGSMDDLKAELWGIDPDTIVH